MKEISWGFGSDFTSSFTYEEVTYTISVPTMEQLNELLVKMKTEYNIPNEIEVTIKTKEECKKDLWIESFENLKPNDKWIIETTMQELKSYPYAERKNVNQVLAIAKNKLINAGYKTNCTRCNGLGHYSFNQADGTTCFKCRGARYEISKLTKAVKKEIQEHFRKED